MDWDYVNDWLAFLFRWLHVIAGIVWIGTSFYFVALDKHLRPPKGAEPGGDVAGETWEIHGGGFYRVEKFRVAPERLPEPLHWFKWEAYATWLSGFALLVVLYYVDAEVYLIDRGVADLSTVAAILISIGLLLAAVLVYEALCRLLAGRELVLASAFLVAVTAAAWGVSNLFSGRGTYLQLGAMLGTIMAANVLLVIIPGHWELVRAKQTGREPDPAPGLEGKRRSIHNTYLTLPVLLAMISIHFPTAYAHEHGWAALVALMAISAWVRHYFNLRHEGRTVWWIPATAALAVVALAVAIEPDEAGAPAAGSPPAFGQVRAIIATRCAECHSAAPTNGAFSTPPAGVVLDTPEQIAAQADAIDEQAVRTRAMPLGNLTKMTDSERRVLAAWIEAGAPTR